MQAFKVSVKETEHNKLVKFASQGRGSVRIQAVFYSGRNPSQNLYLYDGDNDLCSIPIPGQLDRKVIPLDPVTVKLPLSYIDTDDQGNEVVVFGEMG